MKRQHQMDLLVIQYLKKLDVHPVTIAEALDNKIYAKTYQILQENPTISKRDFLKKLGIVEYRR